jgi:methionyl-tRNA synthetase
VNALPHLGTAYEKIGADAIARYHRLAGDDVFFLMGNDEHSQNVAAAATREGLDPLAYCDSMEPKFREVWRALDVSFDEFIRTTEPRHHEAVREILRRAEASGDLYQGRYEGYYCVGCEAFVPEKDLVQGACPNHGKVPEWISEENWFFRLSKYAEPLKRHYETHPEFVRPEAFRNELLAVLSDGLRDVSVSREGSTWGVPFPFDDSTRVYVWFDALINYLTGVGFASEDERFAKWWPADVHVIGKDITRFHCLIWPAMLLSAGLPLPQTVSVHGFITVEGGKKLSKSLGTVVDPVLEVANWGADPVRYFLLREMTWGRDGDYSQTRVAERYEADLANDLGNLLNRVLNLVEKNFDGMVPTPPAPPADDPVRAVTLAAAEAFARRMEEFDPQGAILAVFEVVARANRYADERQPWKVVKQPDGRAAAAGTLWHLLEALRHVVLRLSPVMPGKMAEAWRQLGLGEIASARLADVSDFAFPEGVRVARGAPLFPRREKKE